MDRQTNKIMRPNWRKLPLILILAYFSQVYPYVHFHHSHDEQGLPLEISVHPVGVHPDAIEDHHDDVHHHHRFNKIIDCRLVRTCSNYTLSLIHLLNLSHRIASEPGDGPRSTTWVGERDSHPELVRTDPFVCRGPPTLI